MQGPQNDLERGQERAALRERKKGSNKMRLRPCRAFVPVLVKSSAGLQGTLFAHSQE